MLSHHAHARGLESPTNLTVIKRRGIIGRLKPKKIVTLNLPIIPLHITTLLLLHITTLLQLSDFTLQYCL